MALSLNKPKRDNLASDIWKSAERLRGKFKSYEYQSVILPIIVIRRLECVLIDWRKQISAANLKKEQEFHASDLSFRVRLMAQGEEQTVAFTVTPKDNAAKNRYQPPRPAKELLAEFWRLEKEAEKMLEGLAK